MPTRREFLIAVGYGGGVSNLTPHIDRLTAQGLRFVNAHVNIAACQPCLQSLMTGRYPHRNGRRVSSPSTSTFRPWGKASGKPGISTE